VGDKGGQVSRLTIIKSLIWRSSYKGDLRIRWSGILWTVLGIGGVFACAAFFGGEVASVLACLLLLFLVIDVARYRRKHPDDPWLNEPSL
jgi:hypothetical protein